MSTPKNKQNKYDTVVNKQIDSYFHTSYTATTVNKILEIYEEVTHKMLCQSCKTGCVDTKLEVTCTYNPTFVITRKNYCLTCWLQKVKLRT